MKINTLILLILLPILCQAQPHEKDNNPRFMFQYSGGYFADVFFRNASYDNPAFNRVHHGNYHQIEGLMRTSNTLWAGIMYRQAVLQRPFSDPGGFFWNQQQKVVYWHLGLLTRKDFFQASKHSLSISGGPLIRSLAAVRIEYLDELQLNTINPSGDTIRIRTLAEPYVKESRELDLGLTAGAEYLYALTPCLRLGIQAQASFMMFYGLESLQTGAIIRTLF